MRFPLFTCHIHASGVVWAGKLIVTAILGALIAGCQADLGSGRENGQNSDDALNELVHRYVLASPLLDECIEEWGLGPENRFDMSFQLHPSGELTTPEVKGGHKDLNECLAETVVKIRLPEDSVTKIKSISISIR